MSNHDSDPGPATAEDLAGVDDLDEIVPAPLNPHVEERINWWLAGPAVALILAVALSAAVGLVLLKPPPKKRKAPPRVTGVEVVTAAEQRIRPRIAGLARVRPRRTVSVSAEVAGRVVKLHPRLDDGEVLAAGELALEIDERDYRIERDRLAATLAASQAEVKRLDGESEYLERRLKVGADLVEVARKDLERLEELRSTGVEAARQLEAAEQVLLRAEDTQLILQRQRDTLAPQLAAAQARAAESESRLERAELDLARTKVRLPFSGLLNAVSVEAGQRVPAGQALFELWEVDTVEVPVVLTLDEAHLVSPDLGQLKSEPLSGIEVEVRYQDEGADRRWQGRLKRFEPIDPTTHTVRAVVEVQNSPGQVPLLPGVFCQVDFEAPELEPVLALPLEAIQEGSRVYVVETDEQGADRLRIRQVSLGRSLGEWRVIEAGLAVGERVVASLIDRAIEGSLVVTTEESGGAPGTSSQDPAPTSGEAK